ncbi:MAG: putative manganese-dependent inorganic diphosphatase [Clostridiales bacterium]|nr:putative manganese-dependent inorganic diphosphatase [Clostridiales bacterium]
MNQKPIYVIGHKNPDTDSICAAIAYANLKNILSDGQQKYIPKRAGHTNRETKYVLKFFKMKKPGYVDTLEPRIREVTMRETAGIDLEASLKTAWEQMNEENLRTLPVYQDGKFIGLITQGDIARSMMEEHASTALSSSAVSCKNILDTLDGTLVVGDINAVFREGKVAIGAANPELMTQYIQPHSMVIMGNRSDAQISALEQGADWLIVCLGSEVFELIKKLARENGCNIISTPYSTYRTARLINQSMPVRHVMYSGPVISFHESDFVKDARKTMTKKRLRYFPVLDKDDQVMGLISQRNLLDLHKQQVILVDHNEQTQSVDGIEAAEVVEVVDHHRIGGIQTIAPVYFRNQPLGCTCTIIAQMYQESGVEITPAMAGIMCSAILSDTLCFKSPTCTPVDEAVARDLAKIAGIDPEEHAANMFRAGSQISDKTEEEIFYQDFKTFSVEGFQMGVGQVTVIGAEMVEELRGRMLPFMQQILERTHLDMVFLMLTDIMKESSVVLYVGDQRKLNLPEVVSSAFGVQAGPDSAELPGVVSRKKQMMPSLTIAIQTM